MPDRLETPEEQRARILAALERQAKAPRTPTGVVADDGRRLISRDTLIHRLRRRVARLGGTMKACRGLDRRIVIALDGERLAGELEVLAVQLELFNPLLERLA